MGKRKNWSEEDLEYLQDRWGTISIRAIAKNLDRSLNAVKQKAKRIGLSDASLCYEGITVNQLSYALNISYTILKHWIKVYGFPARKKIFSNTARVWVVTYSDFWKWAEANKQMIDFARVEPNILGEEPAWVTEKRNADLLKKMRIKKSHNHPWTYEEDNILKGMLHAFRYTYPEIAQRVNRSEGAVKRRIWQLGLKARPVRLNNHIKYTEEELILIETLLEKGHCLEDIAARINKSAIGVRGKLERLGYTFINGVPTKRPKDDSTENICTSSRK